jgi:hypothetical protein
MYAGKSEACSLTSDACIHFCVRVKRGSLCGKGSFLGRILLACGSFSKCASAEAKNLAARPPTCPSLPPAVSFCGARNLKQNFRSQYGLIIPSFGKSWAIYIYILSTAEWDGPQPRLRPEDYLFGFACVKTVSRPPYLLSIRLRGT